MVYANLGCCSKRHIPIVRWRQLVWVQDRRLDDDRHADAVRQDSPGRWCGEDAVCLECAQKRTQATRADEEEKNGATVARLELDDNACHGRGDDRVEAILKRNKIVLFL